MQRAGAHYRGERLCKPHAGLAVASVTVKLVSEIDADTHLMRSVTWSHQSPNMSSSLYLRLPSSSVPPAATDSRPQPHNETKQHAASPLIDSLGLETPLACSSHPSINDLSAAQAGVAWRRHMPGPGSAALGHNAAACCMQAARQRGTTAPHPLPCRHGLPHQQAPCGF